MDGQVEQEICGNCKKEIPQHNYVMHTAHCARNITLCQICKEPVPKAQFDTHKASCQPPVKSVKPKSVVPPTNLENSYYFKERKSVEDVKKAARNERKLQKYERLVDTGYTLNQTNSKPVLEKQESVKQAVAPVQTQAQSGGAKPKTKPTQNGGLLACKYCDLELPKLDLDEHENYCGSRTDKCLECGELVMFKYKQIHMDSNHGFLKLKDEPGPRASWDSSTPRVVPTNESMFSSTPTRRRSNLSPLRTFSTFDPTPYLPSIYTRSAQMNGNSKKEGESYKDISRRLDCKTEYIRNLLHDSASITIPLRHSGTAPRNHFNHNKGPAPEPPRRRRNPPTEILIPCEFCSTPIYHEELIAHETGCRPDLTRLRRRRSPEPDDYFVAPPMDEPEPQPTSPEVELPCEFCSDMIPASQLLRHQATCI